MCLELRDVAKRVLEHLRVPAQSVTPRITAPACCMAINPPCCMVAQLGAVCVGKLVLPGRTSGQPSYLLFRPAEQLRLALCDLCHQVIVSSASTRGKARPFVAARCTLGPSCCCCQLLAALFIDVSLQTCVVVRD